MSKAYGFMSWASGSLAIALLAITLFVADGRQAKATDCNCGQFPGMGPGYQAWLTCTQNCANGNGGGYVCTDYSATFPCKCQKNENGSPKVNDECGVTTAAENNLCKETECKCYQDSQTMATSCSRDSNPP